LLLRSGSCWLGGCPAGQLDASVDSALRDRGRRGRSIDYRSTGGRQRARRKSAVGLRFSREHRLRRFDFPGWRRTGPEVFREKWKESSAVGLIGFAAPFLGATAVSLLCAGLVPGGQAGLAAWRFPPTKFRVAVVYAVMLELGFNRTKLWPRRFWRPASSIEPGYGDCVGPHLLALYAEDGRFPGRCHWPCSRPFPLRLPGYSSVTADAFPKLETQLHSFPAVRHGAVRLSGQRVAAGLQLSGMVS